jgi:hypothetical protein
MRNPITMVAQMLPNAKKLSAQRGMAAPFVFGLWPAVFLFMGFVIGMGTARCRPVAES